MPVCLLLRSHSSSAHLSSSQSSSSHSSSSHLSSRIHARELLISFALSALKNACQIMCYWASWHLFVRCTANQRRCAARLSFKPCAKWAVCRCIMPAEWLLSDEALMCDSHDAAHLHTNPALSCWLIACRCFSWHWCGRLYCQSHTVWHLCRYACLNDWVYSMSMYESHEWVNNAVNE